MVYVGIDPGVKGSMCILDSRLKALVFVDFDLSEYIKYFIKMIASLDDDVEIMVAVEKVHAMPGQGVSSCFSFGQRLGELEGMLLTLGVPYELVPPKNWQKACGIQPKSDKKAIADVLQKLYPTAELYGNKGGLKDGRSDALGLAHYLRLRYKGN